jgi:hypothetical protein
MNSPRQSALKLLVSGVLATFLTAVLAISVSQASAPAQAPAAQVAHLIIEGPPAC